MKRNDRDFGSNAVHVQTHRDWLESWSRRHGEAWERLFEADPRSALFEACVRAELQRQGVEVSPFARKKQRSPDFECRRDGIRFFVEAKMMVDEKAAKETAMPATFDLNGKPFHYVDFTRIAPRLIDEKLPQCESVDAPCLVAIGTFAFWPSVLCGDELHTDHLLTGRTGVGGTLDGASGDTASPLFMTQRVEQSCFLSVNVRTNCLEPVRQGVAGLLLFGVGCMPWQTIGVLHPQPNHSFDRRALPATRFRALEPGWERGRLNTRGV